MLDAPIGEDWLRAFLKTLTKRPDKIFMADGREQTVKISRHCRNNMRLYKISERDILVTVESPDGSDKEGDKIVAMKNLQGKFSGYPLKVVYEKIGDEFFVITAYPLKKRMWR